MPSGCAALLQDLLEVVLPSLLSTKTKTSGTPRVLPRAGTGPRSPRNTGGSLERNVRLGGLQGILREARQPALLLRNLQRQCPKSPEPSQQARSAETRPSNRARRPRLGVSSSPDFAISFFGATDVTPTWSARRASKPSSAVNRAETPSGKAAGDCSIAIRRSSAGGIAMKTRPRRRTFFMVMP
jgi:hypothetical protein